METLNGYHQVADLHLFLVHITSHVLLEALHRIGNLIAKLADALVESLILLTDFREVVLVARLLLR